MSAVKKATTPELVAINDLLKTRLRQGADGTFVYEPGWSDERIGKAVAPHLGRNHVARARLELFGSLRVTRPAAGDLVARVERLEQHLEELETRVLGTVVDVGRAPGQSFPFMTRLEHELESRKGEKDPASGD